MLSIKFPHFEVTGAPYQQGAPGGLFVKKGGFQGFDDMPSGRREAVARPTAHGEFDLPVFRGPRVPSIEGVAIAHSAFELAGLRSFVTGCAADGQSVLISIEHQTQNLSMHARVIEATFTDRGSRGRRVEADFSLHMVCADPRKYGDRNTIAGASVEAFQRGNFPAAPVVEVVGPRSGPYTITGPGGRKVTVSQSLTAGQTHRIDFATGGVTRNGSRQLGALTHFTPWSVPPGTIVPMSISAGSMTVVVADTYM